MQNTLQKLKESRWTSRLFSPVILVLLVLLFSVLTGGRFSNLRNLRMVVDQALVVATVASGAVFIFATGNDDMRPVMSGVLFKFRRKRS